MAQNTKRVSLLLFVGTLVSLIGRLLYTQSNGDNLISLYDRVEISIEVSADQNPGMHGEVAYASAPGEGHIHIRNLLSSYSEAPNGISIFQGLITTVHSIQENAVDMKTRYENGDGSGLRQKAEAIINLLVGNQNPDYKDWDGDGNLVSSFDGYGLLPNGTQLGNIQALSLETKYAAAESDTKANLVKNAGICAQNLSTWALSLRQTMLTILSSPAGSNLDLQIADSIKLSDQLMLGYDLNSDR